MKNNASILFFADRLPPLIGGMEMHARYFIEYFANHSKFPLAGIVTKNTEQKDCLLSQNGMQTVILSGLSSIFKPDFIFFNSGRWIEKMILLKKTFPSAFFLYRTGGNEILKASLDKNFIEDHSKRQRYWVNALNETIDVLITNSFYTEQRLRQIGIACSFFRSVGGVNTSALKMVKQVSKDYILLFCAARFVPYKNHALLIKVLKNLISCGHKIQLRLAGDGPLLKQIKEQVKQENLESVVQFLGVLDNEETCKEIASADVYIQLSNDYKTKVPGGYYTHSECMGRSILEALTAGTFVIAGKSGALAEVVTKERGLLIELDDVVSITYQIHHLLLSLPARKPFLADYCWSKVFKQYEKLLEKIHESTFGHGKM